MVFKYTRFTVTTGALAVALSASTGCHSDPDATADSNLALGTVNDHCPVLGFKKVKASAPTREFDGQTVGFCCDQCPQKWDAWSDEKKSAFVTRQLEHK